jgi:hypothetical protein
MERVTESSMMRSGPCLMEEKEVGEVVWAKSSKAYMFPLEDNADSSAASSS